MVLSNPKSFRLLTSACRWTWILENDVSGFYVDINLLVLFRWLVLSFIPVFKSEMSLIQSLIMTTSCHFNFLTYCLSLSSFSVV